MNTQQKHTVDESNSALHDREVADAVALNQQMERGVDIDVFGSGKQIRLTSVEVRKLVANPTKSGKLPSNRDIMLFMKLCEAKGLNPYVQDAYLVGYDTQEGPKFSCITAHKAMLKRAELAENFDGMESGVIVISKDDGDMQHIEGDVYDEEHFQLLGGWCKIYQKDRSKQVFKTARLKSYDKKRSQWNTDKPWMICKCAEAKALRAGYPNDLSGMYIAEEMPDSEVRPKTQIPDGSETSANDRLSARLSAVTEPEPDAIEDDNAEDQVTKDNRVLTFLDLATSLDSAAKVSALCDEMIADCPKGSEADLDVVIDLENARDELLKRWEKQT